MRVAGTGAAGLSLLGTAGCRLTERFPKRSHNLPTAAQNTNVVVVILDSLRKDHVGAYGNSWIKTPNLDALSKESMRFTHAYPESLPTICARRAIHTGLRSWPFRNYHWYKGITVVRYGWQPIPDDQTTLAEIMREAGYGTYFVTDTQHQFQPSMNFQRGFDAFDFIRGQTTDGYRPVWAFSGETQQIALESPAGTEGLRQYLANTVDRNGEEDWFAPQVFARASEFLEIVSEEDQPFFLVVDSYDPHEPWDPPEEYVSLYDKKSYAGREPYWPAEGSSSRLTKRELQRIRALYAGEVTMADRWFGHFFDKMRNLGLLEHTLLVVLADHGSSHGEHHIVGKPVYALYPEVTDIPFFIRHPEGKGAGETNDYYASTHDVAPTILGFLGIEPPEAMEGQDLSVLLEGHQPKARPYFTLGYHNFVWARDEKYVTFSRSDGAKAKLFDVQEDPQMRRNLSGTHPEVVRRMFEDYVLKDAGGPLPTY